MSIEKISLSLTLLYSALFMGALNTSAFLNRPAVDFFDFFTNYHDNTIKDGTPLTADRIQIEIVSPIHQSSPSMPVTLKSTPSDEVMIKNPSPLSSQPDFSGKSYTIKKGDTLHSIAGQHNISLEELLTANRGIDSRKLQMGQILNLPVKSSTAKITIKAQPGKKMINRTETAAADKSPAPQKRVVSPQEGPGGTHSIISNSQQAAGTENISSSFGKRSDPVSSRQKFHKGIDISRPIGTEVFTWSEGVVAQAGWLHGYGLTVDVVHPNGIKTRYAHLKLANVQKGQKLDEGQIIGQVGNTGRTTGANLHFEVMVAGKLTDPQNYLTENLQIVGSQTTLKKNG